MEDDSKVNKLIRKFNNDETVRKLKSRYENKSFLEILGVGRKEIAHSNFLAWLLDPKESHLLGDFPLRRFLEIIVFSPCKGGEVKQSTQGLEDIITLSEYAITEASTRPEFPVDKGRVDVLIKATINNTKIAVVIENKVEAKEHKKQTDRYFKHYQKEIDNSNLGYVFYVYLKPISNFDLQNLEKPECINQHFIQINYQSIIDYILELALNRNVSEKTNSIINEYLHALSGSNKNNMIMGLSKKDQTMLTDFWDNNESLILFAAKAKRDTAENEDEKESYKEIENAIAKRGSDKLRIALENGALNIGDILLFRPMKTDAHLCNKKDDLFKAEIVDKKSLRWQYNNEIGFLTSLQKAIVNEKGLEGEYSGSAATYWEFDGKTIAKIAKECLIENQ